ncbi:MAG: dihydrofolate reductase family protein [Chloroflexi bacterium]|nr:dihydrofolate reductase family protein [Chloroflexota bacterium]
MVKITPMNRPRIFVNVAMTADGKIDSTARKGAAISSKADKARVDHLRASVDAILVGGRTLLNEDPKLTVKSALLRAERLRKGWPENPSKVGVITDIGAALAPFGDDIVTPKAQGQALPLRHFMTSGPAQVYLFTTRCTTPEVLAAFETAGAMVHSMGEKRVDLVAVFRSLHEAGIHSVLVEGGGTLIAELFRLGLVDELTIYIAPKIYGGKSAPTLADGHGFLPDQAPGLKLVSVTKCDDEGGILVHYLVEHKE